MAVEAKIGPASSKRDVQSASLKESASDMSRSLTTSSIADSDAMMRTAFDAIDLDKDGVLSVIEVRHCLSKLQHTLDADQVLALVQEVAGGTSEITFELFAQMWRRVDNGSDHLALERALTAEAALANEQILKMAFDAIDRDGSGSLTADDVFHCMTNMGKDVSMADVQYLISQVEDDADGCLDFDEFRKLWQMLEEEALRARQAKTDVVFDTFAEMERHRTRERGRSASGVSSGVFLEGKAPGSGENSASVALLKAPGGGGQNGSSVALLDGESAEVASAVQIVANMFEHLSVTQRRKTWLDSKPPYLRAALKPRKGENMHQTLFWGGKDGVERTVMLFQFLFMTPVILAVVGAFLLVRAADLHPLQVTMVSVGLVMVVSLWIVVPEDMLYTIVLVTSVEQLRKQEAINKSVRMNRIKKHLRTLKILRAMQGETNRRKAQGRMELRKQIKASGGNGPISGRISPGGTSIVDPAAKRSLNRAESRRATKQMREELALQRAFDLFDSDHSGFVDGKELQAMLNGMGVVISAEDVQDIVKQYDGDGNGGIDFDEFVCIVGSCEQQMETGDVVAQLFASMDKNGDGTLSRQELAQELLSIPGSGLEQGDVDGLLHDIDGDGDGDISLTEFAAMLDKYS